MEWFKVGDVVKCIEADGEKGFLQHGELYTVKDIDPKSDLIVLEGVQGLWYYNRFVYIGDKEAPYAKSTPLKTQVGGTHYLNMAIQPTMYAHANGLGFIEGCVVKYISRYKIKNGKQDLEKIKHFIDILIELEYPESK